MIRWPEANRGHRALDGGVVLTVRLWILLQEVAESWKRMHLHIDEPFISTLSIVPAKSTSAARDTLELSEIESST